MYPVGKRVVVQNGPDAVKRTGEISGYSIVKRSTFPSEMIPCYIVELDKGVQAQDMWVVHIVVSSNIVTEYNPE